jgi:L-iditol 2-dehydrogenase
MDATMRALVKYDHGPGAMELRRVPVPQPGPDEVLIRVEACGICGTDVHILHGRFACDPPVIVGHEFSGVIAAAGAAVQGWSVGDRVIAEQHVGSCGQCEFCLTGRRQFCPHKRSPGYRSDGAFAEYIVIASSLLHRVPQRVSLHQAALVEPMGITAAAVLGKAGVKPGETVVLLGCGAISLLTLQMVRACGAGKVLVTGIEADERLRFAAARQFGADRCIRSDRVDAVEAVMEETGGAGADLAVDLSGSPRAVEEGLRMLKKDGRFCAVGLPSQPVSLPWADLVLRAPTLFFSYSSDYRAWERCLGMLDRGEVRTELFLRRTFSLEEWEEAFRTAESAEALKVLILPQPGSGQEQGG